MTSYNLFSLPWEATKRNFTRVAHTLGIAQSKTTSEDAANATTENLETRQDSAEAGLLDVTIDDGCGQNLEYPPDQDDDSEIYWQQYYEDLEIQALREQELADLKAERDRRRKTNVGWDAEPEQDRGTEGDTFDDETRNRLEGWPVIDYTPEHPLPVKVQLTWASPLPEFSSIADTDIIKAQGETFEFLSQFLADERYGDISFKNGHGLMNLLLRSVSASAFEAIQRWAPHQLVLLQVQGSDQLELRWWLDLVGKYGRQDPRPAELLDGTTSSLLFEKGDFYKLGHLRQNAVHRYRHFSNSIVKCSVHFLIALGDFERFRQVERTVRTLYGTISGDLKVTQQEHLEMDDSLSLYPKECKTALDLFYTLCGILENVYFRRAKLDRPDWLEERKITVAEQLELYRPEHSTEAWGQGYQYIHESTLRNMVAHRSSYITSPILELDGVESMAESTKARALELEDEDAATEIERITKAAMPHLKARSEAHRAVLADIPAGQLRIMSQQAYKNYRSQDRRMENDWDKVAQRYWTNSLKFSTLAKLKDGIEYYPLSNPVTNS